MLFRHALPSDVQSINDIALCSKASWGYPSEQIARWKADLEIGPETVDKWPTVVVEINGQIAGFAQLNPTQHP